MNRPGRRGSTCLSRTATHGILVLKLLVALVHAAVPNPIGTDSNNSYKRHCEAVPLLRESTRWRDALVTRPGHLVPRQSQRVHTRGEPEGRGVIAVLRCLCCYSKTRRSRLQNHMQKKLQGTLDSKETSATSDGSTDRHDPSPRFSFLLGPYGMQYGAWLARDPTAMSDNSDCQMDWIPLL